MKKLLLLIVALTLTITLSGCASLDNAIKDIESDISGLDRVCEVWQGGTVIASYKDTISIESNDYGNKVIMYRVSDDKRTVIYNAVVICDEVD